MSGMCTIGWMVGLKGAMPKIRPPPGDGKVPDEGEK